MPRLEISPAVNDDLIEIGLYIADILLYSPKGL